MRVLHSLLCLGLLGSGVLAGCSPWSAETPPQPALTRVAGVPFYPQEGFRCGPAAMAMVLDWSGLYVKPAALEAQFFSLKDPRKTLSETANRYGRLAYPITGTNALLTELAAGHPVVVVQNLGVDSAPVWNCAVAVGFDKAQHQILVHGGDQAAKRMPLRLFERLWADTDNWGLVVLRPGELPAAARQPDYVKAVYNLERAGRYWEAVLAYDAGLALWPNDADTLMGLGSSLYLLGDPRGAAEAYRAASVVAPDPSPASAALAQISAELETVAVADKPLSKPVTKPLPRPARAAR